MAAKDQEQEETKKLLSSYVGLSFSFFLATLPENSISLLPTLESQVEQLKARLVTAEEQLKQMKSRRKEDSKANARVVEIFASHRNAWQAEEKRLLQQIEDAAALRSKMEEFERENAELKKRNEELEEMIEFMSRRACGEFEEERLGECVSREWCGGDEDDRHDCNFGFSSEFLASAASKLWSEKATTLWQVGALISNFFEIILKCLSLTEIKDGCISH